MQICADNDETLHSADLFKEPVVLRTKPSPDIVSRLAGALPMPGWILTAPCLRTNCPLTLQAEPFGRRYHSSLVDAIKNQPLTSQPSELRATVPSASRGQCGHVPAAACCRTCGRRGSKRRGERGRPQRHSLLAALPHNTQSGAQQSTTDPTFDSSPAALDCW